VELFLTSNPAFQAQVYRSLPETERSEAIVDRISKAISLGLLKVGERLPRETVLSEMFGVAPSTLREALADLRDQGIVATRRGRSGGTFIIKQPFTSAEVIRTWFHDRSIAEIRDVGDEHSAIAAATVRLACERAEPHEVNRLLELARGVAMTDKPELQARADSRFHIELAVLAQSPRLTNAEIRMQAETVQALWSTVSLIRDPEHVAAEHLALARAIANDAPEDAQKLVLEHIRHDVHHLVDAKLSLGYPMYQQERS
jgi:DNA-binding FadR family transcriptional regulator